MNENLVSPTLKIGTSLLDSNMWIKDSRLLWNVEINRACYPVALNQTLRPKVIYCLGFGDNEEWILESDLLAKGKGTVPLYNEIELTLPMKQFHSPVHPAFRFNQQVLVRSNKRLANVIDCKFTLSISTDLCGEDFWVEGKPVVEYCIPGTQDCTVWIAEAELQIA